MGRAENRNEKSEKRNKKFKFYVMATNGSESTSTSKENPDPH
jgi:hypothetical protein